MRKIPQKMLNKIKNFFKELYTRPVWRVVLNKYFVASLAFALIVIFFDNNNVGQWYKTRKKLRDQQEQIQTYKRDIKTIDEKINQLKSQKDSLEKFARENYLFLEDSEDVYIVE